MVGRTRKVRQNRQINKRYCGRVGGPVGNVVRQIGLGLGRAGKGEELVSGIPIRAALGNDPDTHAPLFGIPHDLEMLADILDGIDDTYALAEVMTT